MLNKLIDCVMIVAGIPEAFAEAVLNRRSWSDRVADRVVEKLDARRGNVTINNIGISKGLPGISEQLTEQVAAMQAAGPHA